MRPKVGKICVDRLFRALSGVSGDCEGVKAALDSKQYEVALSGCLSVQAAYLRSLVAMRDLFRQCNATTQFEHSLEALFLLAEELENG